MFLDTNLFFLDWWMDVYLSTVWIWSILVLFGLKRWCSRLQTLSIEFRRNLTTQGWKCSLFARQAPKTPFVSYFRNCGHSTYHALIASGVLFLVFCLYGSQISSFYGAPGATVEERAGQCLKLFSGMRPSLGQQRWTRSLERNDFTISSKQAL